MKLSRIISERGTAAVEGAIVILPCMASLGAVISLGLIATVMARAAQLTIVADLEMYKAAELNLADPFQNSAPSTVRSMAVGHPNSTARTQATQYLKSKLDKEESHDMAFLNYVAAANRESGEAIGFSDDTSYPQIAASVSELGSSFLLKSTLHRFSSQIPVPGISQLVITSSVVRVKDDLKSAANQITNNVPDDVGLTTDPGGTGTGGKGAMG